MSMTLRLPDDPREHQQFLQDLLRSNDELRQQADDAKSRVEELQRVLDQTANDYDKLKEEHAELAQTLALMRRYVFGRRHERFADAPGQGHLFEVPEFIDEPQPTVPTVEDRPVPQQAKTARAPRRTRIDHLPHIRIEHDLPSSEKTCSCCGKEKTCIGQDESRELDLIPARMEVKVHVLPKYACPKCRDGVSSPPVPPKPIPGGIAGAGLVSFVIVSKCADHLPLYRLEDILTRYGVYLSRSTLCDWVRNAALLLEPLAELQKSLVLRSPILWTDDTPVTVLGGRDGGSSKGRFWVYIGNDDHPYSVYDFTMSRGRDGPAAFLKGYHGFLQADAYGGYDGIFLGSDGQIEEVACWCTRAEVLRCAFECAERGESSSRVDPAALRCRRSREGTDTSRSPDAASTGVGTNPGSDPRILGQRVRAELAQVRAWESDHLRPEPVGCVATIHERRSVDHRQQRIRENATTSGHRPEELGVPGECGCRAAGIDLIHDLGGSQAPSPGAVGVCSRGDTAIVRG